MTGIKRIVGLLIATIAMLVVPVAMAQADPFGLDIDNAVIDLGGISGVRAIDSTLTPPDPPATLDGTLTGNVVEIPQAGFVFPEKTAEVSPGIDAVINMEANEDIEGTYDDATGTLILDASLKATVEVLASTCVISPIVLTLSTDNPKPYLGESFTPGLGGTGAVSAAWTGLPPVTGGGQCGVVAGLIGGPGGIWMSQGIVTPETCVTDPTNPKCVTPEEPPTAAPRIISGPESVTGSPTADFTFTKGATETQPVAGYVCSLDGAAFEACDSGSKGYTGLSDGSHTFKVKSKNGAGEGPEGTATWSITKKPDGTAKFGPLSVKPKNKTVKAGKKATFTAKIKNVGDAAAANVKICVKAPKKLVSVKKCQTIGSIAAGATGSAKFKVTVKKSAKKGKKATLKFKATGTDLAAKSATAKVKVK